MAKGKPPKAKGVPNKHLHARSTFLYQAATYLTLHAGSAPKTTERDTLANQMSHSDESVAQGYSGLALQLGSHLHTVSRKGQVRLSVHLKRSMCKSCNAVLIPGRTSSHRIENGSKGQKKPWADVLVIECTLCGGNKRFPVGAQRQPKKSERGNQKIDSNGKDTETNQSSTPAAVTGTDQTSTPG
ncbi:Rpr2-domain-containing protein [Trematosphaeria pertusa]|uniref:Rpr2-domain-containing protein n=1 Tax=Trematosphaeria pertusa TaxID=390896 RepID=A0A6A6J2K2_9PLEO|nr:Rpr2-domain-containing protein [Trematosphaeria pertusa]KAF2257075.1 Rpr2-domain-containing protein [Trematosphaeria pertusa]